MIDECCIRQCVHPLHSDMKMKYLTDIKIIYESLLEDTQIKKQEREVKWNKKQNTSFHHFFSYFFKASPPPRLSGPTEKPEGKKITTRRTDGNVVLIPLRILEDEPNLVTGEPIKCGNCFAVLTSTGVLETDGEIKMWKWWEDILILLLLVCLCSIVNMRPENVLKLGSVDRCLGGILFHVIVSHGEVSCSNWSGIILVIQP